MFAPFLIFLSLLTVYTRGVSSSVFGGDNADIALSYFYAGVPHPPGYPLNTILGWLITRLPVGSTFAFRANFVSAVFTVLAISILYLIIFKLTKSKIVSIIGSATLAFVPLIWLYAHIAEVFQLTMVLVLASVYFLIKWLELDKKKQKKNFKFIFLSITFLGLAVFHHQTAILLLPSYAYILLKKRKIIFADAKKYIFLLGAFLIGFLPYIYIPIAAFRKTPINWDDPVTFERFFRLITRGDYGTFQASTGLLGFSAKARFVQVLWYFKVLRTDFTYLGLILIVVGLLWLFRKNRQLFMFICLNLFFSGPFFLFYASFPLTNVFFEGINERFLITNYMFLGIALGLGIYSLSRILGDYLQKVARYKILVVLLVALLFGFLPFTFFFINYPKTDMSKSNEGSFLARDILNSARPTGLLLISGDTTAFNTLYEYYVEKVNRDSVIIGGGRLKYPEYRVAVKKEYPNLILPDDFATNDSNDSSKMLSVLIYNNKDKMPIYSLVAISVPSDYEWVQQGMVKRLYKKTDRPDPEQLTQIINERINSFEYDEKKTQKNYMNLFTEDIVNYYSDNFDSNAAILLDIGKLGDARKLFERVLENDPKNIRAFIGLGLLYSKWGDCDNSLKNYLSAAQLDKEDGHILEGIANLYRDCFKDQVRADEFFEKAKSIQIKITHSDVKDL